jgi:aminomethyltransferase
MNAAKRTALYRSHLTLGARMTEFAGFAMPLRYRSIIEEHRAVRTAAGAFDLSHMGEIEVGGSGAPALLERALTNSVAALAVGRAHYTLMCGDDGGIIDDLIVYRVGEQRYVLCVNAANTEADFERLHELNAARAKLRNLSDETALVAVQGPRAVRTLQGLAEAELAAVARFGVVDVAIAGVPCTAARTGYTGEDGFELFVDAGVAQRLWDAVLDAGASDGLLACGLGARDTLRLEAGLPLYGHELDRTTTPLDARLERFVKFGRGFAGEDALRRRAAAGAAKRLIGIATNDRRSVARQGYKLFREDCEVGVVTSGTFAPTFERPLAMAYVTTREVGLEEIREGAGLDVEIRTRRVPATVMALPFYRRAPDSDAPDRIRNPSTPTHRAC